MLKFLDPHFAEMFHLRPIADGPRQLDWGSVEVRYGFKVPADYRELLDVYGPGRLGDFFSLLDPFSTNPYLTFETAQEQTEVYDSLARDFPEDYPRPAFPEPGSFFPFAVDDNGGYLFWEMGEDGLGARVGIQSRDAEELCFDLTATQLLMRLARGPIKDAPLPLDLWSMPLRYVPFGCAE